MVKADLTRDYYGDLELPPSADAAEIKKQFKKLALTYHPDRNPGRESEVTSKFQAIQSAHEVLTDDAERSKYDSSRARNNRRSAHASSSSSGVRGNPWANAGSEWAPPPKAPTARRYPPPPSAGAKRYEKFDAPKTNPHWGANEGAEARARTYEAWENMRGHPTSAAKPNTGKPTTPLRGWGTPRPPPREPPPFGREETHARNQAHPKARAPYADFRPTETPPRRSDSVNKKGFVPGTPGGDEPAAPRGNYFTTQRAAPEPPPVPPRNPSPVPPNAHPSMASHMADPLRPFRDDAPVYETRTSTPYATQGGEKFNPFEETNMHRSKSTREPAAPRHVPRTGSDPNLGSPQAKSFAERQQRSRKPVPRKVEVESDGHGSTSDEMGPPLSGGPFGKPRASLKASNGCKPAAQAPQMPKASQTSTQPSKPTTNIGRFRQWMRENPGVEPPLNGFPPDGPPLRSDPAKPANTNEAKMYENFPHLSVNEENRRTSVNFNKYSELSGTKHAKIPLSKSSPYRSTANRSPRPFPKGARPRTPPSGALPDHQDLNAFEKQQRSVIDQLLSSKNQSSSSNICASSPASKNTPRQEGQNVANGSTRSNSDHWQGRRTSALWESPSKKLKSVKHLHSVHPEPTKNARVFWQNHEKMKQNANYSPRPNRFSFNYDDETFKPTSPVPNKGASASAENINTKFTPRDWEGKFEFGTQYFEPAGNPTSPRARTQSNSRSRGRSPVKLQTKIPNLAPMESPGGTKFSPDQWNQTFRPQTFAPPARIPVRQNTGRKSRPTTTRPTMGTAAVVDDSETSDEKPLFESKPTAAPAPPSAFPPSPDAMDVDTPPVSNTVPKFNGHLNGNKDGLKRPAGASESQSHPTVDEEVLKVNFDDLNIQDLISSQALPPPPPGPVDPPPPTMSESITLEAAQKYQSEFVAYMNNWDHFNNKMLLHFMSRKTQNDRFGSRRWEGDEAALIYRRGLIEDGQVTKYWQDARENHEKVVRGYMVIRERMRTREEHERILNGVGETLARPRKKTH
ncbi:hypothetical protein BJ875DRAFT_444198 [Amylocarpus encephaloides]|uniref:J domain-containing protein n=1 Tax=Amylocarpus encephaloides TaxID=45428 RepID=A0A9P7YCW3_9HELO|nr:hypothetical protein BJ875DRAFT_444198 [Amylocarpus encephaloides]